MTTFLKRTPKGVSGKKKTTYLGIRLQSVVGCRNMTRGLIKDREWLFETFD
jgi:hypothetical protein